MSWLLNSLSPPIAQSVIFFESATAIWNDIRDRFSHSDLLRIPELQETIYGLKQGSLYVSEYYTSLKSHWEELDNYRPFPKCKCFAKTYHQHDFVIRFLKGLADGFSVVRSQILLMDPLPPISRVFSMVVQQERQHSLLPCRRRIKYFCQLEVHVFWKGMQWWPSRRFPKCSHAQYFQHEVCAT